MQHLRALKAPHLPDISPKDLASHLKASPRPLHIGKELIASWAARSSWTLKDGLATLTAVVGHDRAVEVELGKRGRGYLHPSTQRISIPFGLFLDAFILDRIPSTSTSTTPTSEDSSRGSSELPSAYLAQSDLLDIPQLAALLPPLPHFRSGPQSSMYRRTMWIGPGGSFTPFHRDPYIGLYSQILGSKTFHVLPPQASGLLSLSTDQLQRNASTIPTPLSNLFVPCSHPPNSAPPDVLEEHAAADYVANEKVPAGVHPEAFSRHQRDLLEAFTLDGACEATLEPGESIVIPEGWFHTAEGGSGAGVGVGAWFR